MSDKSQIQNMDLQQQKYGIVFKPYRWETEPKSFGPIWWKWGPARDDWNKHLERELEKKYLEEKSKRDREASGGWMSWLPLECFSLASKQQQQSAVELEDIPPLTRPTPPKPAVRDFKNLVVSFHFPKEILRKPEWIPSPAEWMVELRHFFVDLPQQLGQLERFSAMMTADTGTDTTATTTDHEDNTRSLAHWKDYQLPDGAAGESVVEHLYYHNPHQSLYPNLKCTRRIVFSQREKGGKWLTGRWMVVAYVSASTPEALQQLDWCQLISPDTMAE